MEPRVRAPARQLALLLGLSFGPRFAGAQPGQAQKLQAPSWLSEQGKELFHDIESEDESLGANACEMRVKLLTEMMGKGDQDAPAHRSRVLQSIGMCELKKYNWKEGKKRLEQAIAELPMDEAAMMKNEMMASLPLMKQVADFMDKEELTQAGTAGRRGREIQVRGLKSLLKMVVKQQPEGQRPPLDPILAEIPGMGKTGNYLPMIIKQVPMAKENLVKLEFMDSILAELDTRLIALSPSQKKKRTRLDVSNTGQELGTLSYVRALAMEPTAPAKQLAAAQQMSVTVADVFEKEAKDLKKGQTLIKRTKDGPGCKADGGLEKTCKALKKIADVATNGFGESRVLVLKPDKKLTLDVCNTNANVGILLASTDGVTVTVGTGKTQSLTSGEPLVVDFCEEITLTAASAVPVLFAQAWHPEYAAVERTTDLRSRAKAFGLSKDDEKAAAKAVNDAAKKDWDKTAKTWRTGSELVKSLKDSIKGAKDAKAAADEAAAEAKRKEDEGDDEQRKKDLEELQRKRKAREEKAAKDEEKRLKRAQVLEEERAKRDPWLNAPEVKEVEKKIEDLKEARRDANAKMEFDVSTELTKEISAAERELKKVTKKARKAYKKSGKVPDGKQAAAEAAPELDLKALKERLEQVLKEKKAAADADEFSKAKTLKKEEDDLRAKIKAKEEL